MVTTRTIPEENKLSHYREAVNKYGQKIMVPVIDVRDGVVERMMGMQIIKFGNKSTFINYTEYNRSHKTTK